MKFRAFGVTFESDFETLFPKSNETDLEVIEHVQTIEPSGVLIHDAADFENGPHLEVYDGEQSRFVRYRDFTASISSGAIQIAHTPHDIGWTTRVLERVILPIAMLYWNPDWFAMHGSAVEKEGGAFLFCGEPHVGKSTTAFELMRRGARLITDDLCLVDASGCARGAAATLRSWHPIDDERVIEVGPVAPETKKKWYCFDETAGCFEPTLLQRVFVLRRGDAFRIEPIVGADKAAAVLDQVFGFTEDPKSEASARFKSVTRWVRDTEIVSCTIPHDKSRAETYDELWRHL